MKLLVLKALSVGKPFLIQWDSVVCQSFSVCLFLPNSVIDKCRNTGRVIDASPWPAEGVD